MYRCSKCEKDHRYNSDIGKKHLKFKEESVLTKCDGCGKEIPEWLDICWYCGVFRNKRIKELIDDLDENMVDTTELQDEIMEQIRKSRRISTTKLAEKLSRDKRGLMRSLDGLRKKGLVKFKEGKNDKIWSTA